jgi:hypothetical protein
VLSSAVTEIDDDESRVALDELESVFPLELVASDSSARHESEASANVNEGASVFLDIIGA